MINGELIVDNFAGGGGASTGIELATGKSVDSLNDVERVEAALEHIRGMKGYEVIEARYFNRKSGGDNYTWEEIAGTLAGSDGYSENLNEKTVRAYKNKLIKEMAVYLFGSDAI